MIRGPLSALVFIFAFAQPTYASETVPEDDHATAEEAENIDPAIAALPASMRRHGVAGHVPPPEGLEILDPDILARMRERLILISQDGEQ